MNCVVRRPVPELFERLAEVLEHLGVDDIDGAGRREECDEPRDAVQDSRDFIGGRFEWCLDGAGLRFRSVERIRTE